MSLFFNNCGKLTSAEVSSTANSIAADGDNTDNPGSEVPVINPNAPEKIAIIDPPPETTNSRDASFSFTPVEGVEVVCRVDTGEFVACGNPQLYTALPAGDHVFEIKGVNSFGDSEVEAFRWRVNAPDITAPTFSLINKPLDNTGFRKAHFELSFADNLSGMEFIRCRLDGGPFTNCQTEVTYYDLPVGQHVWTVVLTDQAGNSTGNVNFTWTVDPNLPAEPPAAPSALMSFFISSRGVNSGNLGGLNGADQFCQQTAASVGAGGKTWRAYLSVDANSPVGLVNARDRIGSGPWYDYKGAVVAMNVNTLHMNGLAPLNMLDEAGADLGKQRYDHDILTGSNVNGTLRANGTCQNWTSNNGGDRGMVGHADWKDNPPYISNGQNWNNSHLTPCSTNGMKNNLGDGKLYCFATD